MKLGTLNQMSTIISERKFVQMEFKISSEMENGVVNWRKNLVRQIGGHGNDNFWQDIIRSWRRNNGDEHDNNVQLIWVTLEDSIDNSCDDRWETTNSWPTNLANLGKTCWQIDDLVKFQHFLAHLYPVDDTQTRTWLWSHQHNFNNDWMNCHMCH